MIGLQATMKGAQRTVKGLKAEHLRHKKAMNTAVRVRGFKLMRLLRKEIRAGAPGGRKLAPLSVMRRVMFAELRKGRLRANKPLAPLARAIGYEVPRRDPLAMKIGFVGPASSATWRRLGKMHQEGFTTSVNAPFFRSRSTTIEQFLREQGSMVDHAVFGGRKARRRNVFFLKKSTRQLRTPARPIIVPFMQRYERESLMKIRRDFVRKLRGERI